MAAENVPNPPIPATTVMPRHTYLHYSPNNLYFDARNTNTQFPIIPEIILAHPLNHVITYNPNDSPRHVTEVYLQQLWHTLKESTTKDETQCLTGIVDQMEIQLTYLSLRKVLRLPTPNRYPPKTEYDPTPTGTALLDLVCQIGYNGELTKIADFKRSKVVPMWQTLYAIIVRTLTGYFGGIVGGTFYCLQLFVGMAFHMHLDYGLLIWADLVRMVRKKQTPSKRKVFIPYMRFLTMILEQIVAKTPEIAKRLQDPSVEIPKMLKLNRILAMPDVDTMAIPTSLLRMLDQESVIVQDYLREHKIPPLEQLEPAASTQGVLGSGEGPSARGLQDQEQRVASGKGEQERQNLERGGGVGEGGAIHESEDDFDPTVEAVCYGTSSDSLGESFKCAQSAADSERTPTALSVNAEQEAQSERSPLVQIQHQNILHDLPDVDRTLGDLEVQFTPPKESTPVSVAPDQSATVQTTSTSHAGTLENVDSEAHKSLYGIATAYESESSNEAPSLDQYVVVSLEGRENDEVEKNESERYVRKEKDDCDGVPSPKSREATSATGLTIVQSGIETNTVVPTGHALIPTIHSAFSQQSDVSCHGDLAHTLPATHSEFAGIERSGHPLQSTFVFPSQLSLAQLTENMFHLDRTRFATSAHVGDVCGTSVVEPSSGQPRGSDGSPTSANIMPTLSVGHTVATTAVLTGTLIEPGVTMDLKRYIDLKFSNFQFNIACEVSAKSTFFETKLNDLAASVDFLKTKPAPVVERDYAIDELKNLLHAKLNSVAKPNQEQKDMLSALQNQQPHTFTSNTLKDDILTAVSKMTETITKTMTKTLSEFGKRIDVLESTCKTQAESSKRKHDDPDRHKGEKRRRLYMSAQSSLRFNRC